MLRTPLHNFHVDNGGKLVEFAGWEMPMMYSGIHEEHHQVRTSGGIFDVSHMGRIRLTGRHARRFLERVCSRRISDMQSGQCRYSLVCNEHGGVKDDVIVYRMDEDEFLMVVNAANREKILSHFEQVKAAGELAVKIDDQTTSTAMVALQGPKVMQLISRFSSEIPSLKRYRFAVKNLIFLKLIVSRTGYTGEDGVEVILPASAISMAMSLLLRDIDLKSEKAAVKPAGLGARDTLRLEAGMPLYGHELGEETNALSSGVDFAISLDKHTHERGERFIGQDALEKTAAAGGPDRKLVGVALEGKRTARQGMAVQLASGGSPDQSLDQSGGREIGTITSACLSPTLGHAIAMALIDRAHTEPGTNLVIDTGRGMLEGKVVPLPFYKAAKAT